MSIREMRKKKGITQSELAERCGVTQAYISMIERNGNLNLSINVLCNLATALDIPPMQLVEEYVGGKGENVIA